MRFGLSEETIHAIQSVLKRDQGIEQAILYGSRAKGNYSTGSDIDLTLIAPGLTTDSLLRLLNSIDELMLPYKIDLSLLHQIEADDLLDHVRRVGIVFYSRD